MKLEKNEVKPGEGVMANGLPAKTSAGKLFGFNRIYDRTAPASAGPYMTRMWIGRLRLHIFHRGDADPDAHDHPWPFWTFPFTSYVEEVATFRPPMDDGGGNAIEWAGKEGLVPEQHRQIVPAWRWSYRPATHTHRVLGPVAPGVYGLGDGYPFAKSGAIVTLVWRGKPERTWGFLRNRDGNWCWTNWREYVFGGGKDAPCGDSPGYTAVRKPEVRHREQRFGDFLLGEFFEEGRSIRRASWPEGDHIDADGAEGGTIWYYSAEDDDLTPGYKLSFHDLGAGDWEILE